MLRNKMFGYGFCLIISLTICFMFYLKANFKGDSPDTDSHVQINSDLKSEYDLVQPYDKNEKGEVLSRKYLAQNINEEYPTLDSRVKEIAGRGRSSINTLTPNVLIQNMSYSSAWQTVEEPSSDLPLTLEERYDGREFIRFNPLKIESLVPGDTLSIPVFQDNREYTMKVTSVEVYDDGNVTWYGLLEDFENLNQISITRAETLTMGEITTPNGHYTLEVRGSNGWIVNSGTLFKFQSDHEDIVFPKDEVGGDYKTQVGSFESSNIVPINI